MRMCINFVCMVARKSMWLVAIAAASVWILLALPTFASAALFDPPLGTTIFNRVIQQLCEIQQALGNRVRLADPARCAPPPPPPPPPATLTLIKMVVNDNGGIATPSDFTVHLHQAPDMVDVPGSPQPGSATGTTYADLAPGSYHVAETGGLSGYVASLSDDCDMSGNITLAAGENKTCTITNDDTAGRLIVDKVTVPAGSAAVFTVMATGTGAISAGGAGTITDATSTEFIVSAGTYSVSESALTGWIQVSNTCVDVVVGIGETKTCTIVNHRLPKLTVTKIVINDDGGTATTSDFVLFVDGATTTSGVQNVYATGIRMVSEGAHDGYTSTIGGDCASDGAVTLAIGDIKSCTVTNNDNPPAQGALLITEVLYDLPNDDSKGTENQNEWVEIYNGTNVVINVGGFTLGDGNATSTIPENTLLVPGTYLIVTGSTTTAMFWSIPEDAVLVAVANAEIGNGLANTGDHVVLTSSLGIEMDAVSWGNDTAVFTPSVPDVSPGSSIVRTSNTTDTNAAADWVGDATPTPGSTS